MFDKLANFILKHAKVLVAIWIIALLVAIPFAINSNSVLKYDITGMSGADSESVDGLKVMNANFYQSVSSDADVAVTYNSAEELALIKGTFAADLQTDLNNKYGSGKVIATYLGAYNKDSTAVATKGVVIFALTFDSTLNTVDETPNVRSVVSEAKTDSGLTATT